ncbi:ribosomal RNA-processing protein 8 [Podospora australis]|uniref:Ribosomal RNA-processing protein 8 n=1 Tax=Podospora australis TaxID=1536484 RepID=A0AAN6X4L6_9PEZI|nr:ribosomal RNA-processing protein 8 [Podospora australis]
MFPVKGLKVSAEKLKIETEHGAPILAANATNAAAAAPASKPSKKRKRPGQTPVTTENLSDMWDKVIEHKEQPGQQPKKPKPDASGANKTKVTPKAAEKKQKVAKQQNKEKPESKDEDADSFNGFDDEEEAPKPVSKKQKKSKDTTTAKPEQPPKPTPKESKPAAPVPSGPTLTPLQAAMREKLVSARFRHLNETLYTRPSAEAFSLFSESPEMFTEYHEGFRRQVDVWPENPVDTYIADIKARAKLRIPPRARDEPRPAQQIMLPRDWDTKICTIADLGCGDAKLATTLTPLSKKLKLEIHSYDLQTGGNPLVVKSDIANLPAPNDSVDVVIFCLALMGTNWTDFIEEAYRILRWKGELWVAEIKSRFAGAAAANQKVVMHSVGNLQKNNTAGTAGKKNAKKAEQAQEEKAEELAELAVQVDGVEQKKQETDISAFVEALKARGFLLNRDMGEYAVDMSNKMFVRMNFIKGAPATKGKCAPKEARDADRKEAGRDRKKFLGGGGDDKGKGEAAILKPCVYKLR